MTGEQTTNSTQPDPPLEELDKTIASLNVWLASIDSANVELKLKVTDRILKAMDLRRKLAPSKGKGGKFGKMSGAK